MTENEAIKIINDKYETFFALSTTNDFDMAMAESIKALEEIKQYRAIGTIEEFKALKKKHIGSDNMVISSSDLMTILNSDSEKEIRAKAIDEFISELYKIGEDREFDWEDIYRLAEQLKEGAE